ncbi:MAG: CHAT domain-containing protein, partial [Balneolaceae bacterium]|nr:CHAT domain-containing protein [Balneolaceae bacterium]
FNHYRVNKDFTSAKNYLEKAQVLAQEQQDQYDLAQLSFLEGTLYRDVESNFSHALTSFDKALSLISVDNNYTSYQNILTEKARLLEKKQEYQEAKDIYRRVLQKAQERNDPRNSLYAAFNKANVHLQLEQEDSARVMIDTLSTKNLDALDFYQLVKARTVQARYFNQAGQPNEGTRILQPVIEQIVKRSRGSGDLETGFWQIEPEYLNAFETYANLLIDHGEPEQAVEALDQLKTINDAALYQNPLVRSKVLNEEELSRYKRLTEDLDALRKQLLTARGEEQAELQQQIDEKSAQKNALDRKITANANPEPIAVNYIQRRMDAHQRVLHITELNDTYYLAVISRTGVTYSKVPITQDLRSHLEETIGQIAAGNTDLKDLYPITQLLKVDALPDHVNKLTIIPDSYLYQLPLDILPVNPPAHGQSYGEATYLIERFRTNYMTSLNDFKAIASNKADHTYNYAGFGVSSFGEDRKALVPLPQAKAEIKNISDQLTALNHKKSFINDAATEQAFRQSAPKARILHMATHSEVSGRDPMFSSIYLSRGQQNSDNKFPGRIFAYELFELNLRNELIMLNSCESGSGSYLQGTGVVGISRALRYAGAQSLVLNLWSVNDMMASEFAVQFYKGINNGKTKSEALRDAKLHFLKTKNANPHYWGSYMLLGDEQAIVQPNKFTNNLVAASFLIFFFSLTIASSIIEIMKRRKRLGKAE